MDNTLAKLITLIIAGLIFVAVVIYEFYIEPKISNKKYRLRNLNILFECNKCKKLSRKYQQIIKEKTDMEYCSLINKDRYIKNCPHCYSDSLHEYDGEQYEWMKHHQDCTALTKETFKIFKNGLDEMERIAYEMRSAEKFQEYNDLEVDKC